MAALPVPARLVAFIVLACTAAAAWAVDVPVTDTAQLQAAIAAAQPGQRIVLAPGVYQPAGNLVCNVAGSAAQPIEVRAQVAGTATVRFSAGTAEGFRVLMPHWRFTGLVVEGACALPADCEHAFHLAGDADFTRIVGNRLVDFNAQIKSNGNNGAFPDDVLVEGNQLYDTVARPTDKPVTKIDVVGGRRWVVRGNTIFDFAKAGGDQISYGAFLKGGSREGVFERNLVQCARQHSGGTRIGLSLGGGGTGAGFCDGSCDPEHSDGVLRNNLVLACSDVGIYINRGANTRIFHNTLYATAGIDLRFASTTGVVSNNLLSGAIRNRDAATSTQAANLVQVSPQNFAQWFVAPGAGDFRRLDGSAYVNLGVATQPPTADDFCGNLRDDGLPDIGALEYDAQFDCFTTAGGGVGPRLFRDGFEG